MNFGKIARISGALTRSLKRFQHGSEVVTASNQSLPPNLVLYGISKEQFEPESQQEEVKSPGPETPIIRKCNGEIPKNKSPITVWVDSFKNVEQQRQVSAQLHPLIFGAHPRMDILHEVMRWQQRYRDVNYTWSRTRAELGRGKQKPWPQKGTGRVRQGSRAGPGWKMGGIAHGPRGPVSLYYKPADDVILKGLTIALTVKLVQDDLIVVDDVEIPEADTNFFNDVINSRNLSENSLLFMHAENDFPQNLSEIVSNSRTLSLMPASALNVWSMLKHDKLILPLSMLDDLETKILWHMNRYPWLGKPHNFYKDMPGKKGLKFEQEQYLAEQQRESDENVSQ
ncbi:large ribosomal subunit protein uL4m-like [Clavelina lepadiformis]|uniref:large ribosomal subunit protein uL4m-like n=1 Tax=Clavelina lepadiformis TaxID=159417 RepID=UPI004041F45A